MGLNRAVVAEALCGPLLHRAEASGQRFSEPCEIVQQSPRAFKKTFRRLQKKNSANQTKRRDVFPSRRSH
ncbi:hypothetical protein BACCOPRO_02374 [Phocaeicola coprophilus DSM 18228 = JCM 13818]|uniref:Uncharacterized protein n=1 Tax=Phocaeicola coprophilus DSM 18228 = JCM 13818 TaxID=547042 RepID=S0F8W0_9BACT|nr:hypothetical protein BACCOPRO_02374 [Phocaeicola coprophilus DSM 18228 = JCM 13818]